MLTIEQAMNTLRLENDDEETKEIVSGLLNAVPLYIEQSTGMSEAEQSDCPVVDTLTGFLLRLWYYPEGTDTDRIRKVIDDLLKSVTLLRKNNG